MNNGEARRILWEDPEIKATLKKAEAIQQALDALDGYTGDSDYERGYKDGKEDYKAHYGWKSLECAEPEYNTYVLVKTAEKGGYYIVSHTVSGWFLDNGVPFKKQIYQWKPLEDDE